MEDENENQGNTALAMGKRITIFSMWVFPKIGVGHPNHPMFNRIFHYFHHPFWGTIIFGNTHVANHQRFVSVTRKKGKLPAVFFRKVMTDTDTGRVFVMGGRSVEDEILDSVEVIW